jgi:hypothetical protein
MYFRTISFQEQQGASQGSPEHLGPPCRRRETQGTELARFTAENRPMQMNWLRLTPMAMKHESVKKNCRVRETLWSG